MEWGKSYYSHILEIETTQTDPATVKCPHTWKKTPKVGSCYKVYEVAQTWDNARKACQNTTWMNWAPDLMNIKEKGAEETLLSQLPRGRSYWVLDSFRHEVNI
ncbi:hypothetical protein ElyMa_004713600 [Elysia marginata]|uniref:C-type lectin domain-containing protein n=1 Tax=Elysia marginata TaxID=1093978 RepID=A0AAV4IA60_9GAST|nr:hypothetical protein ElyMa_004713600 [Elysia marginata]